MKNPAADEEPTDRAIQSAKGEPRRVTVALTGVLVLFLLSLPGYVSPQTLPTLPTSYHPYVHEGPQTGGYWDIAVDDTTFLIGFRGNHLTPIVDTGIFRLYRCAEITATAGFDYFVLIGGDPDGKAYPALLLPFSYGLIRVYKGAAPVDDPRAFNAKVLLQALEPAIVR